MVAHQDMHFPVIRLNLGVNRWCFFRSFLGRFMQPVDFIGFGGVVGYLNSYLNP